MISLFQFSYCPWYQVHSNYVGTLDNLGPIVISVVEEFETSTIRALVREPSKTHHLCTEQRATGLFSSQKMKSSLKSILDKSSLNIPQKLLKRVRAETLCKSINAFDRSHVRTLPMDDIVLTENSWFPGGSLVSYIAKKGRTLMTNGLEMVISSKISLYLSNSHF